MKEYGIELNQDDKGYWAEIWSEEMLNHYGSILRKKIRVREYIDSIKDKPFRTRTLAIKAAMDRIEEIRRADSIQK